MQHMASCPNCNYTIMLGTKFCGNCGAPLFESYQPQMNRPEKENPLTVSVELLANECGMFMGCLSWVSFDLEMMKKTVQRLDKMKREVKVALGGEQQVKDLTTNSMGMINNLAPMVEYLGACFVSYIAKFFDDNPSMHNQQKEEFFEVIETRMKQLGNFQDIKMKLDIMSTTISVL